MNLRRLARNPWTWGVTAVLALGLAVALAAFQPWKLFTNTTVVEALPTAGVAAPSGTRTPSGTGAPSGASSTTSRPAGPRLVARGNLVAHEHRTSGVVALYALGDGSHVVRLEGLDTSDGPDLHVWLTDAPVRPGREGWFVFDDGRYVDLGPLKGNRGDQNYVVPAATELAGLTSVSVWCARFHVSFGAAELR